jgi:ATP-dependent helicase HrpA
VTVHVPLRVLPQLRPEGFDWLIGAWRGELVTALLRSLPKDLRTRLVPVPDTAAAAVALLRPRRGPFLDALAAAVQQVRGVPIPREAWDESRLPAHLRMHFRVEDERGGVVAEGSDLDGLRHDVAPRLRAELARAAAPLERHGMRAWELDSLPRAVALPGTGQAVRGYPALVDEGGTAGVRVLETREAQRAAMRAGTRRLLLLTVPSPARWVNDRLSGPERLALADRLDDVIVATVDALMDAAGGPAWDAAGFARLRDHVAGELAEATLANARAVARILDAAREVRARLEPLTAAPLLPARRDVERQLRRLVPPGFVSRAGARRLGDIERYLRAAARRLERLPNAPAVDRDRMSAIHELEDAYHRRVEAWPRGRPLPDALREAPWMLEELRVSHFAQALGTRGPISGKRIRRALEEVGA